MTPEARARVEIDRLVEAAGRRACDYEAANIYAATGLVIREFPLIEGRGHADYLIYFDGKTAGVIRRRSCATVKWRIRRK